MNRKRSTPRASFSLIALGLLTALVVTGFGMSYVLLQNEQIKLSRQIDTLQSHIGEHKVAITGFEADIETHLSKLALEDWLAQSHSTLVKIPAGAIETCPRPREADAPDRALAVAQ